MNVESPCLYTGQCQIYFRSHSLDLFERDDVWLLSSSILGFIVLPDVRLGLLRPATVVVSQDFLSKDDKSLSQTKFNLFLC